MRRLFILIALITTLPGCALFRPESVQAPALSEAKQSLYALKTWRMEGRIGVQTAEEAWQANLFWEHDPTQDRLRVSGPLSQGMISIVLQKNLIYVNEGDGVTQLSHDPDTLLRERLGFTVPLSSLRYWILGVPDSERAYTPVYGRDGALSGFRQAGWAVRMERFMNVDNHVVPQKMQVQGSGVKLKIIADTWDIKG